VSFFIACRTPRTVVVARTAYSTPEAAEQAIQSRYANQSCWVVEADYPATAALRAATQHERSPLSPAGRAF
jgi:hypothetical protein